MNKTGQSSSEISPVIITIDIERDILPEELKIISHINKKFSNNEISLSIDKGTLIAHLYKLDPLQFSSEINALIVSYRIDCVYANGLENIFDTLIHKILEICSYGIRYRKRVYAGYADERKVVGRKEKESKRGAYFYAHNHDFHDEINLLSEKYVNNIICGESEEILSKFPDNCIDLIITSPPYNFGLDYSSSGDSTNWEAYLDKLFRVFSEGIRVLKYGGRFIVNVQPLFSDYIPLHHLISTFFMNKKMIWKGEILWEKNNYNCKYTSWGSWKSPSSPYLKYTWEFIEIFCKGNIKKQGNSEDADISDEEFKSWVVAKWSIGPERRMKQYNHPAMFPEELVERCLKLFSFKGDIILDPFNGAGTTTKVACKTGRRYVGIDISTEYCNVARERLREQETNTPVLKNEKKKTKMKDSSSDISGTGRRRGRPPRQQKMEVESSQHLLDRFYSEQT